jgi:hypothetical protein
MVDGIHMVLDRSRMGPVEAHAGVDEFCEDLSEAWCS